MRIRIDTALDACVAINLIASRRCNEIARACRARLVLVKTVAAETKNLAVALDPEPGVEPLDFEVVEMSPAEQAEFVEFARKLDEGEAATLAVAKGRRMPVATDDRAALKLIARQEPQLDVVRTSTLLRGWAAEGQPEPGELADALTRIEEDAQFVPPPSDPHADWWRSARLARTAA